MPANSITEQSDRELLLGILDTMKEGDDNERHKAIEDQLPKVHDKEVARDNLILLLNDSEAEVRGWTATALAKLCGQEDEKARTAISQHLEKEVESLPHFWMLLALSRMGDKKEIESVVRSVAGDNRKEFDYTNERSGPLALALLASWKDRDAIMRLETMLRSQVFDQMWLACRALQTVSCREMLEPLRHVAKDLGTWPDIRNKCVKALSKIESPAAIQALGQVLTGERDAIIKESAIEGLERLGQSSLVRDMLYRLNQSPDCMADSLMLALMDKNAQIRHRAAEALPIVMINPKDYGDGSEEAKERALAQARIRAAKKVVGELVRERVDLNSGVPLLVDALRVIDPPEAEAAATVLTNSKYLYSDDVSVKQRVELALKLVGGEKAVQTLMGQKSEVLRTYNDLLTKADEPIQELFKETMRQAQQSFTISQGMSITVFVVGVITLLAGLYVAFTAGEAGIQFVFGAGTSLVAVIAVVLDMMFRDPHKRVQEATSVLLRIKVIFLGYVRQIHQVDASFKHEFIERGKDFGTAETQETVKQISDVMQHTMDMVVLHLPVSKSEKLAVDELLKPWQERLETAARAAEEEAESSAKKTRDGKETADASPEASPSADVAGNQ
jgi:HEAT repeat protein